MRSFAETSQFQENFEVYIQALISQCLDANFLDEVFADQGKFSRYLWGQYRQHLSTSFLYKIFQHFCCKQDLSKLRQVLAKLRQITAQK